MKFIKDGLIIENNNPIFDSLYLKQGWLPVSDGVEAESIVDEPKNNITDDKPDEAQTNDTHPADEQITLGDVVGDDATVLAKTKPTTPRRTYQKRK